MISFGVQAPDIDRVQMLLGHIPGAAEKAMSRAINKAVNSAKTEAIREIKDRYTISDTEIRKSIKVVPATAKRLSAKLIATSALHRIAKFKTSKSSGGAISEIVSGKRKTWPSGFFARLKSGHVGLFTRAKEFTKIESGRYAKNKEREATRGESRGAVGTSLKRQRILEATTLPTSTMMGYHEVIEKTLDIAEKNLNSELDRQIDLFLSGKVS